MQIRDQVFLSTLVSCRSHQMEISLCHAIGALHLICTPNVTRHDFMASILSVGHMAYWSA